MGSIFDGQRVFGPRKAARLALFSSGALVLAACSGSKDPAPNFNWDVRPILSNNCFRCHGLDEDARKGGLRLDVRDTATAEPPETPGKTAIVPGNPEASELIRRVPRRIRTS